MKRNVWIGSVAAMAIAYSGGIAAQSSNAQGNRNQSSQNIITVTGCLQQADRMSSGTTGSETTSTADSTSTSKSPSSGSDRFILTNASMGSDSSSTTTAPESTRSNTQSSPASTATSTSGTTGAESSAKSMGSSGSMYTLDGRATELRPHLNHQVQITGRLDSTNGTGSTATTTATSATSADTPGTQRPANSGQRLHVESVRMIAATCPSR